eukprot:TRINITY_DN443_c0_g1_i1.p1 TRINITY_DN443_c0_g1~~TRINITY_DN443_c0_g1_i1.p1  ORF type:complete len:1532 (-),score=247.42 TRINITY_DN443_c0_g1_i1:2270-6865(-)
MENSANKRLGRIHQVRQFLDKMNWPELSLEKQKELLGKYREMAEENEGLKMKIEVMQKLLESYKKSYLKLRGGEVRERIVSEKNVQTEKKEEELEIQANFSFIDKVMLKSRAEAQTETKPTLSFNVTAGFNKVGAVRVSNATQTVNAREEKGIQAYELIDKIHGITQTDSKTLLHSNIQTVSAPIEHCGKVAEVDRIIQKTEFGILTEDISEKEFAHVGDYTVDKKQRIIENTATQSVNEDFLETKGTQTEYSEYADKSNESRAQTTATSYFAIDAPEAVTTPLKTHNSEIGSDQKVTTTAETKSEYKEKYDFLEQVHVSSFNIKSESVQPEIKPTAPFDTFTTEMVSIRFEKSKRQDEVEVETCKAELSSATFEIISVQNLQPKVKYDVSSGIIQEPGESGGKMVGDEQVLGTNQQVENKIRVLNEVVESAEPVKKQYFEHDEELLSLNDAVLNSPIIAAEPRKGELDVRSIGEEEKRVLSDPQSILVVKKKEEAFIQPTNTNGNKISFVETAQEDTEGINVHVATNIKDKNLEECIVKSEHNLEYSAPKKNFKDKNEGTENPTLVHDTIPYYGYQELPKADANALKNPLLMEPTNIDSEGNDVQDIENAISESNKGRNYETLASTRDAQIITSFQDNTELLVVEATKEENEDTTKHCGDVDKTSALPFVSEENKANTDGHDNKEMMTGISPKEMNNTAQEVTKLNAKSEEAIPKMESAIVSKDQKESSLEGKCGSEDNVEKAATRAISQEKVVDELLRTIAENRKNTCNADAKDEPCLEEKSQDVNQAKSLNIHKVSKNLDTEVPITITKPEALSLQGRKKEEEPVQDNTRLASEIISNTLLITPAQEKVEPMPIIESPKQSNRFESSTVSFNLATTSEQNTKVKDNEETYKAEFDEEDLIRSTVQVSEHAEADNLLSNKIVEEASALEPSSKQDLYLESEANKNNPQEKHITKQAEDQKEEKAELSHAVDANLVLEPFIEENAKGIEKSKDKSPIGAGDVKYRKINQEKPQSENTNLIKESVDGGDIHAKKTQADETTNEKDIKKESEQIFGINKESRNKEPHFHSIKFMERPEESSKAKNKEEQQKVEAVLDSTNVASGNKSENIVSPNEVNDEAFSHQSIKEEAKKPEVEIDNSNNDLRPMVATIEQNVPLRDINAILEGTEKDTNILHLLNPQSTEEGKCKVKNEDKFEGIIHSQTQAGVYERIETTPKNKQAAERHEEDKVKNERISSTPITKQISEKVDPNNTKSEYAKDEALDNPDKLQSSDLIYKKSSTIECKELEPTKSNRPKESPYQKELFNKNLATDAKASINVYKPYDSEQVKLRSDLTIFPEAKCEEEPILKTSDFIRSQAHINIQTDHVSSLAEHVNIGSICIDLYKIPQSENEAQTDKELIAKSKFDAVFIFPLILQQAIKKLNVATKLLDSTLSFVNSFIESSDDQTHRYNVLRIENELESLLSSLNYDIQFLWYQSQQGLICVLLYDAQHITPATTNTTNARNPTMAFQDVIVFHILIHFALYFRAFIELAT